MIGAPLEAVQKEWIFDLNAEGGRIDLLAEHSLAANRLRGALDAHSEA